MFQALISQLDIILKIVINTIIVSIPEEIYILMLTLILMGEFDYWKEKECRKLINSWDYPRILIPSVTVALLLNIIRYTELKNYSWIQIIPMTLFFILIVITNDVLQDSSAVKWIGKALISYIFSFITVALIEMSYMPFIIYGVNIDLAQVNNSIKLNFMLSFPGRVIEYSILAYFISGKRSKLKVNLLKKIFANPILSVLFSMVLIFNLVFLILMINVIAYQKVLINLNVLLQLFIIIGIITYPIINISSLIWTVWYIENKKTVESQDIY